MTRVIIAVVGALGLAFVWRAAQLYQGSDPLAYRMVLLIGVGMLAGLVELLLRATRVARLTDALLALPKTIGREDIEKTNEPLRGLIESRLNGTPTNLGSAVFTSYLLGLLVMMGLLGTFMGLFETLAGAREALTASGDVTALREGLAAPMKGLSRAFGTSATGVACSALLGLGAVFLRRAETRFVELAGELNRAVPRFVVRRTEVALGSRGLRLAGGLVDTLLDRPMAEAEATRVAAALSVGVERAGIDA